MSLISQSRIPTMKRSVLTYKDGTLSPRTGKEALISESLMDVADFWQSASSKLDNSKFDKADTEDGVVETDLVDGSIFAHLESQNLTAPMLAAPQVGDSFTLKQQPGEIVLDGTNLVTIRESEAEKSIVVQSKTDQNVHQSVVFDKATDTITVEFPEYPRHRF